MCVLLFPDIGQRSIQRDPIASQHIETIDLE